LAKYAFILLFEIFYFYIQITSMYKYFNVHLCALLHPIEFAIRSFRSSSSEANTLTIILIRAYIKASIIARGLAKKSTVTFHSG